MEYFEFDLETNCPVYTLHATPLILECVCFVRIVTDFRIIYLKIQNKTTANNELQNTHTLSTEEKLFELFDSRP